MSDLPETTNADVQARGALPPSVGIWVRSDGSLVLSCTDGWFLVVGRDQPSLGPAILDFCRRHARCAAH